MRREEGERGTQAAPACRGQAGKEHGIRETEKSKRGRSNQRDSRVAMRCQG